jgi:hypothetical protein
MPKGPPHIDRLSFNWIEARLVDNHDKDEIASSFFETYKRASLIPSKNINARWGDHYRRTRAITQFRQSLPLVMAKTARNISDRL